MMDETKYNIIYWSLPTVLIIVGIILIITKYTDGYAIQGYSILSLGVVSLLVLGFMKLLNNGRRMNKQGLCRTKIFLEK